MACAASRRELLATGLFAALASIAGKTFATPAPMTGAPSRTHVQKDMEAELLRIYRDASPAEQDAILRLMRRTLAGDDMHAVGVECLMAFGWTEADARVRATAVLSASHKGDGA